MRKLLLTIGLVLWASTSWAWVGGIIVIDTPADVTYPQVSKYGNHATGLFIRHHRHLLTLAGKTAYFVVVTDEAYEDVLKPYFTSALAATRGDKGYKGSTCWKQLYDDYPGPAKQILLYPVVQLNPVTQVNETVMKTVKQAQDLGVSIVKSKVRAPIKWSGLNVTDSVE